MKNIEIAKLISDGTILLQWLIIGYLFYSVNNQISIALFIAFALGIASKVFIARQEEKEELIFIQKLKERIEKENEEFEKSFDKNSEQ